MLRNLAEVTPSAARGFEAWFRLWRETKGSTGHRLMMLVKKVFGPKQVKLEQVSCALEEWEHHVHTLELAGQRLGPVLKTFGLMQMLPEEVEMDLVKMRQQLTNYAKCRAWVLDQAVMRPEGGRAELTR